MKKRLLIYTLLSLTTGIPCSKAQDKRVTYPLDPLTALEMIKVVSILKDNKTISAKDIFNIINLKEPPKQEVLNFQPGTTFKREAFTSFYNYSKKGITEAIVDLNLGKVISVKHLPNVTGMFLEADTIINEIAASDQAWIMALKKRGIAIDSVTHHGIFAGDAGIAPIGHREKLIVARFIKNEVVIDGLIAYVDLTTRKILKIVEEEKGFNNRVDLNYFDENSAKEVQQGPKPLMISQPEGHTFTIEGHEVSWGNWKLRYGLDNREGLVIYDVRYTVNGKVRAILYRGSMPEMVVPYAAPSLYQSTFNFFDAGSYRLCQGDTRSMSPGADAPENAEYLPAIFHKENGTPFQIDRAVAIYEEYGGTLWRHGSVSKRATNLVIKYYTTIENYDYGFIWRFRQDGTIDVEVELTGIVKVRGVHRINEMDKPNPNDHSYKGYGFGTLVKPNVEAMNHQHFFAFRLDMDIDGPNYNSVMEMNTTLVPPGKENPFGNTFYVAHTKFKTEKEAQRNINYESARNWHIINNNQMTSLGQHSGYMLMPGMQAKVFAAQGTALRKKASFLNHHFWVTPYKEDEVYPAGKYPASNKIYDGIEEWTVKNRAIDNNDVVVWYIAGITHIVRPEEWPVMPVHRMGFSLMPFGFFEENPTMEIKNPDFMRKFKKVENKQTGSAIEHR